MMDVVAIAKNEIINRGYSVDRLCLCYSYGTTKNIAWYLKIPGRSKLTTKKQMWEAIYNVLKDPEAYRSDMYVRLASYWRSVNR